MTFQWPFPTSCTAMPCSGAASLFFSLICHSLSVDINSSRQALWFNMPVLISGWALWFGPSAECCFHTHCTFTAFDCLWLISSAHMAGSWLYFPFPSWLPLSKSYDCALLVISSLLCAMMMPQLPWLIHSSPGIILLHCLHGFTLFAYIFLQGPPPSYLGLLPWIFILWFIVNTFFLQSSEMLPNISLENTFSKLAFPYCDQVSPHLFLGLPLGLFVRCTNCWLREHWVYAHIKH